MFDPEAFNERIAEIGKYYAGDDLAAMAEAHEQLLASLRSTARSSGSPVAFAAALSYATFLYRLLDEHAQDLDSGLRFERRIATLCRQTAVAEGMAPEVTIPEGAWERGTPAYVRALRREVVMHALAAFVIRMAPGPGPKPRAGDQLDLEVRLVKLGTGRITLLYQRKSAYLWAEGLRVSPLGLRISADRDRANPRRFTVIRVTTVRDDSGAA